MRNKKIYRCNKCGHFFTDSMALHCPKCHVLNGFGCFISAVQYKYRENITDWECKKMRFRVLEQSGGLCLSFNSGDPDPDKKEPFRNLSNGFLPHDEYVLDIACRWFNKAI